MKKVILSAAALFAFTFANAQEATTEANGGFKAGDMFISGSVVFGTQKTGEEKTTNFNVIPRAAYFLTDNIAVGVQIGFTHTKNENTTFVPPAVIDTENKTNAFTAGAFARYYVTPASKFSLFGQLGVNYVTRKTENSTATQTGGVTTTVSTDDKTNGFNIGFAPGMSYFLSDSFALEATFGVLEYNTSKPDADGAESTDQFNIGLNLSNINLGLIYKF